MNIMVRTKKDIVAFSTRLKICCIFDPYSSWSSIFVASDLTARSFNSFISFSRILDGDMFFMKPFWCTKDNVRFENLHRLFSGFRNTANHRPLQSQESFRRIFETLRQLVIVVSDCLI